MFKVCSWCQPKIGWDANLSGESHGICPRCLRKFFPKEYSFIIGKKSTADGTNLRPASIK